MAHNEKASPYLCHSARRKCSAKLLLAAFLIALITVTGCTTNVIREDPISEGLPLIYPDEGVGRQRTVTLYFKLKGEPYLVPVTDVITIRASEYEAEGVMERLTQGPGVLLRDLEGVLPEDARAIKVSVEKDMVYVTLSDEIFGTEGWTSEDRRLSICAIVNSLCALNGISRVQVWDSVGKRLTSSLYGFDTGGSQLLGPLTRQDDIVLTTQKLVERTFARLIDEEYTYAYDLFATSEPGGEKPSYASFETQIKSLGKIESATVLSVNEQAGGVSAEAVADIVFTDPTGVTKKLEKAIIQLVPGERNKMGFYSLLNIFMGEEQSEPLG